MIKCLIVDDEPVARRIIVSYLKDIPHTEIVGSVENAIHAMETLCTSSVNLMFLDIEMPKIKGLDFIRSLSNPPAIVLTTAHREFALDGFDLGVVDYLLKPISFERFFQAINKYKQLYHPSTLSNGESEKEVKFILLKSDRKMHRINVAEIKAVEGMSNYVKVHTNDQAIIVYDSLTSFLKMLPSYFIRTHKSYIVNQLKVNAFDRESIVIEDMVIPIGKSFQRQCLERLQTG